MKVRKHDVKYHKLHDLLDQQVKELCDQALQTDGKLSHSKLKSVGRLRRLIELASLSMPPKRRHRWPIIALFGTTLAIVSILFFARVRTTDIELELSLSEVGFRLPQQQVFADAMQLSTLGVSGLQKIQFPRLGNEDVQTFFSSGGSATSIFLSGGSTGLDTGTITLAPLTLPAGAHLWLHPTTMPSEYRLSIKGKEFLLRANINGSIGVGLPGIPRKQFDLKIPKVIVLQPDENIVDLDIRFKNSSKNFFSNQLIADSLSFFRIDEHFDAERTIVRRVSTILSGTLYFESLGGQERRLRRGEEIDFELAQGEIRSLEFRNDNIGLTFHGSVEGMTLGTGEHRYSIMPTYLEWLKARHGLALLWATTLYFFGLILTIIRWWRNVA
jgi:hypothetical protein